ncbi:MAG: aspartate carbamoyltransferase regulatory subunit [Methanobacteriota archaeon]|nr:MAG: aspartate carbamoyltransferase regulatory subunit [Euryarchaeota archaeon]
MSKKDAMAVSKIKNGTVIDRIPPGKALKVVDLLGLDKEGHTLTIGMFMSSTKMKLKDIVKVHDRTLTKTEIDALGLFAPGVTISTIENYDVRTKIEPKVPEIIEEVLKCNNPTCATNYREPVITKFRVIQVNPLLVRCYYCDRVMLEENIMSQF